jgi:regulator of replication initiation timing
MDTKPLSFFDHLQQGLADIDAKVIRLKEVANGNFMDHATGEDDDDGFQKVRSFESDIKCMHREVSGLKSHVFNLDNELDIIEHKLQDLSSHLNQFVVKNELTKYGYIPWSNPRPVEQPDAPDSQTEKSKQNGKFRLDDSPPPQRQITADAVTTNGSCAAAPVVQQNGHQTNGTSVPNGTPATNGTRSTMKSIIKSVNPAPKSVTIREEDDDRKRKDPRLRVKLDANLCPTPRSAFAPVAAKRFTILPPRAFAPDDEDEDDDVVTLPHKMDVTHVVHDSSHNNPFASDATTRFNLPSLMQSYNMPSFPGTPVANEQSTMNEQETIEFTPGLTTRRPVAVKRCKEPAAATATAAGTILPDRRTNDLANSLKNLSFVGTPTQPIPSRKLIASVKAVKSQGKMKQVGDRLVNMTPQMPGSNIDPNVLKYFLRSKK